MVLRLSRQSVGRYFGGSEGIYVSLHFGCQSLSYHTKQVNSAFNLEVLG